MAMRVKRLNLRVEPERKFFGRIGRKLAALERGQVPEGSDENLSFESLEAFRRIMTPKRIQLLRVIRHDRPSSIYELAKLVRRDMKNVRGDLALLNDLGLVELENGKSPRAVIVPRVNYDELKVAIAI